MLLFHVSRDVGSQTHDCFLFLLELFRLDQVGMEVIHLIWLRALLRITMGIRELSKQCSGVIPPPRLSNRDHRHQPANRQVIYRDPKDGLVLVDSLPVVDVTRFFSIWFSIWL